MQLKVHGPLSILGALAWEHVTLMQKGIEPETFLEATFLAQELQQMYRAVKVRHI